nr:ADP-ribosylglycohydrolase family protein [Oscillatoria sp. FACHB-1406]
MTASEVAIAIFPLAFYSHEHRDSLHARVREAAGVWLHDGENLAELLLWADAIALILREKLPPNRLLDSLLASAIDPAAENLKTLEYLSLQLERATPLEAIARAPEAPSAIALALYSFAATPEAFSLCLDRALRTSLVSPLAPLLVGAIAGLYNSSSGLPARPGLDPSQLQHRQQQARQLFTAWSGSYRLDRWNLNAPVIAGAGMLQARPSLKIISH